MSNLQHIQWKLKIHSHLQVSLVNSTLEEGKLYRKVEITLMLVRIHLANVSW